MGLFHLVFYNQPNNPPNNPPPPPRLLLPPNLQRSPKNPQSCLPEGPLHLGPPPPSAKSHEEASLPCLGKGQLDNFTEYEDWIKRLNKIGSLRHSSKSAKGSCPCGSSWPKEVIIGCVSPPTHPKLSLCGSDFTLLLTLAPTLHYTPVGILFRP